LLRSALLRLSLNEPLGSQTTTYYALLKKYSYVPMLLRNQSIKYFNVIAYYLAYGLPERQPQRAVRTTAERLQEIFSIAKN